MKSFYKQALVFCFCSGLIVSVLAEVHQVQAQEQGCGAVAQASVDDVFNQALKTITMLSDRAVRLRDRGVWQPDRNFADRFLRRGARSLRRIRTLLAQIEDSNVACEVGEVHSCAVQSVPKKKLLKAFDAIFSAPFPSGLESLKNSQRVQRRRFKRKLDELQSSYAVRS